MPDGAAGGTDKEKKVSATTQDMLLALAQMKETQDQAGEVAEVTDINTPRTLYSNQRFLAEQMSLQLMMHLTAERISSMETEFTRRGGGVGMDDFVRIMMAHLPEYLDGDPREEIKAYGLGWGGDSTMYNESNTSKVTEKELVANLCDLFKEIDINGDGDCEWEELTSFIVEKAVVFKERYRVTEISDYLETTINVEPQYRYRHNNYLEKLHYLPKLNQVAVIEQHSPVVSLYNANNGRLVANLKGHRGVPMAMQYVETRNSLFTCCADMTMVAWNLWPDNLQYTVRNCWPTPHVQMAMCWVDTHEQLYSGSTAGMIHAWSVDDREEKSAWYAHNDIVMELLSMPSLDNIASASLDTTISVWDTYTGARRQELRGHAKGVFSLSYNEDYRMLISAGFDHDAFIWSPFVPTLLFKLKGHSGSLVGVESVPGTPEVITADSNGYFKLWDLRNFQCVQTWTDETGLAGMNAFVHSNQSAVPAKAAPTPVGSRVIAATKKLHFFDQGSSEKEPVTDDMHITCACYNATSLTIITAAGRSVKIWNAISGNVQRYYRHLAPSEITSLCLDDRQRKFIVGDDTGRIGVYNYANGALMKSFDTQNGEVSRMLYCDQEKAVISVSAAREVVVHDEMDAEMGVVLRRMDAAQRHDGDVTCCDYSFASSLVATGSTDGLVKVWDFETGKLDCPNPGLEHGAPVSAVKFMGSYPLLVTADVRGVVRLWGVRMTSFKYECAFSFLHGKLECDDGGRETRAQREVELEALTQGQPKTAVKLFLPRVVETTDPIGPHGTDGGEHETEEEARRASVMLVATANEEANEMKRAFETAARTGDEEDLRKAEEARERLRQSRLERRTSTTKARRKSITQLTALVENEMKNTVKQTAEAKGVLLDDDEVDIQDELAVALAAARAEHAVRRKKPRIPRGKYTVPRGPSVVLSIAYDDRAHALYTGDDNGCIQAWDISMAVANLGVKASILPATRLPGQRRTSLLPRVAAAAPPTPMPGKDGDGVFQAPQPCVHQWCVQAHVDCVNLLELVREPPGLLSASSDRCVSMWDTARGFRYGTLLQGLADDMQNPDWDLPVDVARRAADEDAATRRVMDRLWQPPEDEGGAATAESKDASAVEAKAEAKAAKRSSTSRERKEDPAADDPQQQQQGEIMSPAAVAKHQRVMAALHSTNNMRVSTATGPSLFEPPAELQTLKRDSKAEAKQQRGQPQQPFAGDDSVDALVSMAMAGADDKKGEPGLPTGASQSDVFTEYQTFKSSLPPVSTLSTQTFVKLTQGQRGAHRTRNLEAKLAQDKLDMAAAKRRKQLAHSRSASALQHVGRMTLGQRNEALAQAMPPLQPVFSEESKASVARLAEAISSWDKSAGVGSSKRAPPDVAESKQ